MTKPVNMTKQLFKMKVLKVSINLPKEAFKEEEYKSGILKSLRQAFPMKIIQEEINKEFKKNKLRLKKVKYPIQLEAIIKIH